MFILLEPVLSVIIPCSFPAEGWRWRKYPRLLQSDTCLRDGWREGRIDGWMDGPIDCHARRRDTINHRGRALFN